MGTNYYIACKCCGTGIKHIGKSSYGWPFFSMYENIEAVVYDLNEMNNGGDKYEIADEYKRPMSVEDFREFINSREYQGKRMGWEKTDREFS